MSASDESLRKAAAIIQSLERRLESTDAARAEPIAIVGVGCRLPGGVTDLASLWSVLDGGTDAVTPVPIERFDLGPAYHPDPAHAGTTYVREGAFVGAIDGFDADFFGIAPREAAWLDPQHRLLLECTWEALENASIAADRLRNSNVGVYVGIGPSDYAQRAAAADPELVEPYAATGTATSFSAGRISFLLGLRGASLAVDTACSSSLVALHVACRALRAGDCAMALVGGVQIMTAPDPFVLLSRLRALAPDGRCKTFSDRADGYGRGEGCGVVVLRRLADAQRDGDRVLAVIRGTAVNHDGPSSGLTAPNGRAQRAVLEEALANARVLASEVDYVEAHGTGTALGDPIEIDALAQAYGRGRASPLLVGTLKTNMGHLESASGIAGVLKVVASLQNGALPPSLHSDRLNPHLDWKSLPVRVVRKREAWARGERARRAGISSFGMSGTNAHAIVEEAPAPDSSGSAPAAPRSVELIVLSAKNTAALDQMAARLAAHLTLHPALSLRDVAYTLAKGRARLEERVAIVAPTREALIVALDAVARGDTPPSARRDRSRAEVAKTAWLFTGQGSQSVGMGRALYEAWPAYRDALDAAMAALDEHLPRPLRDVMWAVPESSDEALLGQTAFTQPALFAHEWALAALWRSAGAAPDVLLGHSIGELTAACVAGVFSLRDGARLVAARAQLMQALPAGGAMVSLEVGEAEVAAALAADAAASANVAIAAINGSAAVVLAGDEVDVLRVAALFEARGVRSKRLDVSHAFHSPIMDAMLEEFRAVAETVEYRPPTVAVVSNVSGALAGNELMTADYWVRHARATVRFADGVRALHEQGVRTFVEIGPRATLVGLVAACVGDSAVQLIPSLRAGRSEEEAFVAALGAVFVQGGAIDFEGVFPDKGHRVELPTYPWQRERHWVDSRPRAGASLGSMGRYPLAGVGLRMPGSAIHHVIATGPRHQPFLGDHVVYGKVVVPGAFHVAVVLAIAAERWPDRALEMSEVEFVRAIAMEPEGEVELHAVFTPDAEGAGYAFELATRDADVAETRWVTHARGRVRPTDANAGSLPPPAALEARAPRTVDPNLLLDAMSHVRIDWGPLWRWMQDARTGDDASVALLVPTYPGAHSVAPLHPSLLDNGFAAGLLSEELSADRTPSLPFAIERLRFWRAPTGKVRFGGVARAKSGPDTSVVDFVLEDESGGVIAEVQGFTARRAPERAFLAKPRRSSLRWNLDWRPREDSHVRAVPAEPKGGKWILFGRAEPCLVDLAARLAAGGRDVRVARLGVDVEGGDAKSVREWLLAAAAGEPVAGLVGLWGARDAADAADTAHAVAVEALHFLQAFAASVPPGVPTLLCTTDAQRVDGPSTPALATIWGLGRTFRNEHSDRPLVLLDVPGESSPDAAAAAATLWAVVGEMRGGAELRVSGGRLEAASLALAPPVPSLREAASYKLERDGSSTLAGLRAVASERRAPGPGEVEVELETSGLNFRDVLGTLGMYPGDPGPLGLEGAGTIVAVGAGVSGRNVGDRVIAMAGFARHVTLDARRVVPRPASMSAADAGGILGAYLTAWWALRTLANVQPGERVLIHAAAGGVGLAAVHLARHWGCTVLATASPSKWPLLRSIGVEHLASSRERGFAETFRAAVGGVDVVVNSLIGDFIDDSLGLLGPGGRFVELGKREIRDAQSLASRRVGYFTFDVLEIPPEEIAPVMAEVTKGIVAGHLRALPVKVFPFLRAADGFRWMAQGRHVGRVVVASLPASPVSRDGTVLVTGGLGALGMHVARWLATQGVKHVLLVGRQGAAQKSDAVRAELEALAALGLSVRVESVDVADRNALGLLLDSIPPDAPLRGVIHAAGVLDDGAMVGQDASRLRAVLSPKVDGAWNLHVLTRHLDLDLFVLFSSLSGVVGGVGQGTYAAANAFLDSLAMHRRAEGLAASSIAWGPWSEGGMAGGLSEAARSRLARHGIRSFSAATALTALGEVLDAGDAVVVVADLDLQAAAPALQTASSLKARVSRLPAAERRRAMVEAVRAEAARILALPIERVGADAAFRDLGLDSLMAVELRNALAQRIGVTLPATLAFDHPTPDAIAKHLLDDVMQLAENTPAAANEDTAQAEEPIAIVGIGCRFPGGVVDPVSFWRLLEDGTDAVTEVPSDRWDLDAWYDPDPEAVGKMTTRWGAFLPGLEEFEPAFFEISPREAASVDPQERLLLETAWEALESGGFTPDALMGSSTGVYVGLCGNEYQARVMSDTKGVDAYSLLGTAHSTMVGRLSYWLGLKGPNIPVDTACSSSLVAVHLACQALLAGECTLALAGGANVVLEPTATTYFSRLRAMSPTGRCRTFSADADGYVRGEGAGVVVLERLSAAKRNGHRILALIRGTAVNQDGRSNGLTAPNGPSQQAVIREALRRGKVAPESVGYLECHGTGTSLGDPIEVQAASAVLGKGRAPSFPLVLGSVKTNFGHTEGAAGIGGLIKAALVLSHRRIPKNLHFAGPNPMIAWSELPVLVAQEAMEFPQNGGPRRAGVSSFGFSGTNAHAVLEEAPPHDVVLSAPERGAELFLLSAKSDAGLDEVASRLDLFLAGLTEAPALGDLARSLALFRAHHEHRLALVATSHDELRRALAVAGRGEVPPAATRGKKGSGTPTVVFVFPGQGSQWLGMGRELLASEPVFRSVVEACDRAIFAEAGWSLLAELAASPDASRLAHVEIVQPVLFAMGVALAALWRSLGVEPSVVVGHSQGEVAAAYVAGALSLEDAVAIVCRRSNLVKRLSGRGEMVSVQLSMAEAEAAIAGFEERVGVAVSNSLTSTVLSGEPAALATVVSALEARGVHCRRVNVDYASHSPHVDPLMEDLERALAGIAPRPTVVPMRSTVTGAPLEGPELSGAYWAKNLRLRVRFAEVITGLVKDGHTQFVEMSAHPLLVTAIEELLGHTELGGRAVGSLQREQPERASLLASVGAMHVGGCALGFERLFSSGVVRVDLPTYPWQRQRYWIESLASRPSAGESTGHPLLGVRVALAGGEGVFETMVRATQPSWVTDHRVGGRIFVPGTAIVELMRAAAEQCWNGADVELRAAVFQAPIVVRDAGACRLQVVVSSDAEGASHVRVYSQTDDTSATAWALHAEGEAHRVEKSAARFLDLAAVRARCGEAVPPEMLYEAFAGVGLEYGDAFRGVVELHRGEGEAIARLALPAGVSPEGYGVHPALLDAAFQVLGAIDERAEAWLPFAVDRVVVDGGASGAGIVHVRVVERSQETVVADVILTDGEGRVCVEATGLRLKRVDVEELRVKKRAGSAADALYRVRWLTAGVAPGRSDWTEGRWLVVGDDEAATAALCEALQRAGASCARAELGALAEALPAENVVCLWRSTLEKPAEEALRLAGAALAVVQTVAKGSPASRMWWVTTGAASVVHGDSVVELGSSALLGLGHSVQHEYPELACTLVDLPPRAGGPEGLIAELRVGDDERDVAWRDGVRYVARIEKVAPSAAEAAPLRTDGTVFITGGLGALGLHVARWFVGHGVRHLVLTGRRGRATDGAEAAIEELESLGSTVTVAALDVTDRGALAALLHAIPADRPLRAVVHLAGVLDDGVLAEQNAERFARVMAPKVVGASYLDALTRGADLDVFLLFSSATGAFGSAAQGSYAAANSFLDALAARRRAAGLPAQSLAWGVWATGASGAGLASSVDAKRQARLARQGVGLLSVPQGMALFEEARRHPDAHLLLVPLDLKRVGRTADGWVAPLWRSLAPPANKRRTPRGAWTRELAMLPALQRLQAVLDGVRTEIARVLALPNGENIEADKPVQELGFDSLMALNLRNALSHRVGATLPATLAFDHPTPRAIAAFILKRYVDAAGPQAPVTPSRVHVDEPIAIVGMGCRFPGGVTDPESFWRLVESGVDAITEVPRERWDADAWYDPDAATPGKMTTRWGGFVRGIEEFDPVFFGISPREAPSVDPRLRLLLETSWEALERAGMRADQLMDSETGVYVGLCGSEYQARALAGASDEPYALLGSVPSTMVGRLSYWLGLRGPNLPVDTACSSSLVAVHLACQALRAGECSLALAGGAQVVLEPMASVYFSRMGATSPTGRCHTFSADADGYVRGEGAGMVLLERLSDAKRNGRTVLAVIRGSAVNQDGRSNGPTAPNGPAQEAVIRDALQRAGVQPSTVGYLECHGTGTSLGDPIEVQAAAAVFGDGRDADHPLVLASVKTNIGHMEGAAGVGGLIKAALAVSRGRIPMSLHCAHPNPLIPWAELAVKVAETTTDWAANGSPRRAGVSSFGMSGTNAHVVVEQAPPELEVRSAERAVELIVLSAKSPAALEAAASRLAVHVDALPSVHLTNLAYTLTTSRTPHEHRVAFVATSRDALLHALQQISQGESPPRAARAEASPAPRKLAWLFSGQGAQLPRMGRDLAEAWPVVSRAFDAVFAAFAPHLERPLREIMWADGDAAALIDQTEYAQPALFALEVALAALWTSWGVVPDYVAGHSIGELAAAHVSGVLSLEDAARLVAARGRLMQALPPGGAMVSIEAAEAAVAEAVQPHRSEVSLAAMNGPTSTVISGTEAVVLAIAASFAAGGARTKQLTVSHAFHSPLMEPMLLELRRVAESVSYHPARIPVVSTASGKIAGSELSTADYWVEQVRAPVRFAEAVADLHARGVGRYLELGPKPTLLGLVPACLPNGREPLLVASLRPDRPEAHAILEALGAHHVAGGGVSWVSVFPEGARRIELPTYAWQRQRYWIEPTPRDGLATAGVAGAWPLGGVALRIPGAVRHHVLRVGVRHQPFLVDHVVFEKVLVPGTFHLSVMLSIAADYWPNRAIELSAVEFTRAIALETDEEVELHVVLVPQESGEGYSVDLATLIDEGGESRWTSHVRGRMAPSAAEPTRTSHPSELAARTSTDVNMALFYEEMARMRIEWGPDWRWVRDGRAGIDIAVGALAPTYAGAHDLAPLHPVLLDNGFAISFLSVKKPQDNTAPFLPIALERLTWWGKPSGLVHCGARALGQSDDVIRTEFSFVDEKGFVLAEVEGFVARRAPEQAFKRAGKKGTQDSLFCVDWRAQSPEVPARGSLPRGRWAILAADADPVAQRLAEQIRQAGAECSTLSFDRLVEALAFEQLVCLWEDDASGPAARAVDVSILGLAVVQAAVALPSPPRISWVTRGAMSVLPDEPVAAGVASLWGLGRSAAQEHPELGLRLIDAPAAPDAAAAIFRELCLADDESQVAWRAGTRHVARLVRAAAREASRPFTPRPDSSVLITGGLGALGLEVARWLAGRVGHLVLTGRRGLESPSAREEVAKLEAAGSRVTVVAVDVADAVGLRAVVDAIPHDVPLRGVVHAAGVVDDAVLTQQSAERFVRVMSPKVAGTVALDAATCDADLDFFLLFSSSAGTLGSAGQGAYAAANAFMDAWAARRRARGLPAQSLAWGMWVDASNRAIGLAGGTDRAQQARLSRSGLGALSATQGIALIDACLVRPEANILTVPLQLGALRLAFGGAVPALFRELVKPLSRRRPGAWGQELRALPGDQRHEAIVAGVRAEVAQALSLTSVESVPSDGKLLALGLDSLMALELRNVLGERLGVALPATLAFDHPTPAAIAEYVLTRLDEVRDGAGGSLLPARRPETLHAEVVEAQLGNLSTGQQRLWFLDRLTPGSALYNMHFGLRFESALDVELLRGCLKQLVARHEALRTTFPEVAIFPETTEMPRALVTPTGAVPLELVDLTNDEQRDSALERLSTAQSMKPFDLACGPLWRATVVKMSAERHVVLFTQHHIISDARSMAIFMSELVALYGAAGYAGVLPKLPFQYSDFVRHERAMLGEASHSQSVRWWKEHLAGLPRLDIPFSRPAAMPSHAGDAVSVRITKELTQRAKDFARAEATTLFAALLAVWATVLHRYSGQSDFAIATMVAGRDRSEFSNVLGFFVNTLVLRCDLSATPTFKELVGRLQGAVVRALEHQDVEFSEVVREHTATRDRDLNPIVQVSLDLNSTIAGQANESTSAWTLLPPPRADVGVDGTAKFNLGLALIDSADGLIGTLEYSTDLFDRDSVLGIARHFELMLESVLDAPQASIGALPLLAPEEKQRLLVDLNATDREVPPAVTVDAVFHACAVEQPTRTALIFEGQRLTYDELERRSNQMAHLLRGLGVGPEVVVGVCLERSPAMIIALLAILKAGGAYLPLDPSYPADRLAFMLRDSEAPLLVTTRALGGAFERGADEPSLRRVEIERDAGAMAELPDTWQPAKTTGESLAYLIYTSGSTGKPKGVEVLHGGLANVVDDFARLVEVTPDDTLLAVTSLSFDIAALEVFLPLTRGATLHLASREHASDAAWLQTALSGATIMQATPATWQLLVESEWTGQTELRALCGGEALSFALAKRLSDRVGRLWNCYGPTETTIWSTTWLVDPSRGSVSLGAPLANTKVYILDRGLQPVPVGVPGELYIGGAGVARRYRGRPELTSEKFVPDPFAGGSARLYRTGDSVRWASDGTIEFLERLDLQVKIRGFRIEIGEVEAVLAEHPSLARCAVIARKTTGDGHLVAYYVTLEGMAAGADELRTHLRRSLPDYMIPSFFVAVSALPLTPNGKTDRKALSDAEVSQPVEGPRLAPRDQLELALAAIWKEVLQIDAVDVRRTFFEHGGGSLQLVRLQHRIRAELQVRLAVADLFAYPTIEALAAHVRGGAASGGHRGARPLLVDTLRTTVEDDALRGRLLTIEQASPAELSDVLAASLKDLLVEQEPL